MSSPDRGMRKKQRYDKKKMIESAQALVSVQNPVVRAKETFELSFPISIAQDLHEDPETGICCQTDMTGILLTSMEKELNRLTVENSALK